MSRYGNPRSYVVNGKRYRTLESSRGYVERGIASWYGKKFHGRRTSSGEIYDMYGMTAAHKQLPLPTFVEVVNLDNNRSAIVRVNDRGPFHPSRIIDLSYAAAHKLGILKEGTGLVELRAIDPALRRPRNGHPVSTAQGENGIGLYLQVGAFMHRRNAERLTAHLQPLAQTSLRISETLKNGSTIYRVRYGPLDDVEEADRLVGILVSRGLDDFHVILE